MKNGRDCENLRLNRAAKTFDFGHDNYVCGLTMNLISARDPVCSKFVDRFSVLGIKKSWLTQEQQDLNVEACEQYIWRQQK